MLQQLQKFVSVKHLFQQAFIEVLLSTKIIFNAKNTEINKTGSTDMK